MNERDEIEKRAYEIWKATGREDSLANWTQAEREFFSRLKFRSPIKTFEVQPNPNLPPTKE